MSAGTGVAQALLLGEPWIRRAARWGERRRHRIYVDDYWRAAHADMTTAWKQAIAASQDGDVIRAPRLGGTVADELRFSKSNITIEGNGGTYGRPDIKVAAGALFRLFGTGRDNIHARNLVIDCTGGGATWGLYVESCTNWTIDNVTVINPSRSGIVIDANTASRVPSSGNGRGITRCQVFGAARNGISLSGEAGDGTASGPRRFSITHNYLFNVTESSINLSQASGINVADNIVFSSTGVDNGNAGIRLVNGSQHCTITGNNVEGTPRGLMIGAAPNPGDGLTSGHVVTGNTFRRTLHQAMLISGVDLVVNGNTVIDCCQGTPDAAVFFEDVLRASFSGNEVYDSTGTKHRYAVYSRVNTGQCDYLAVKDNVLIGAAVLPLLVVGANSKVDGNVHNTSTSTAAASSLAVRSHSDLWTVTGTGTITAIGATAANPNPANAAVADPQARNGRTLTLVFTDAAVVQHNATIQLAAGVNVVAAAGSVITLRYDGTAWREVSRSGTFGWTTFELGPDWTPGIASLPDVPPPQFRINADGVVHLRGGATRVSTNQQLIGTLPVEARPPVPQTFTSRRVASSAEVNFAVTVEGIVASVGGQAPGSEFVLYHSYPIR